MIIILLDRENERINYAFDFIFGERAVAYELTYDPDYFLSDTPGIRFNYSSHKLDCSFELLPATIMHEKGVSKYRLSEGEYKGISCISFDGQVDPIASVFYILTRYEEYHTEFRDEHGRFPFSKSIQKKTKWIEQAICDRWAKEIIELVDKDIYVESVLRSTLTNSVKLIPTFDIDNAFAYLHKSGLRRFFSILRDFFNGDKKRLKERKMVEAGQIRDPYDTYQEITSIAQDFPATRIFLLFSKRGKKDRNLSPDSIAFQRLIQKMSLSTHTGVHPSYASFGNRDEISHQKESLEMLINKKVECSRQHFLRMSLPETYRSLLEAGITCDYTMGFAEHTGFRSGTARTHNWFDLTKNERTNLTIHPFVYMDGTLNEYMKLSPDEAIKHITQLYSEVREFGGDFVFIWHNETIGEYGKWKNWKAVLDFTLNLGQ